MAPQRPRKYELIVFGATGYTGKLTCEQVLRCAPSTLTWAIAGRSPQKLELLASDYNQAFKDRKPVEVFIANLDEFSIESLVSSTRLLISTIGPYIKYGTAVIEACAVYGTHYVDCTGEYPWTYEMTKRCHKTAQKRGAILIPQCGVESAPLDIGTYLLVKKIREDYDSPTADVRMAVHDFKGRFSGGTLETIMAVFEHATLQEMTEASRFDALSPVGGPEQPWTSPIRRDHDLGVLTSSISNTTDRAIVFRSWGLWDGGQYYGPNFTWREYMRVPHYMSAIFWMVAFTIAPIFPLFAPFRWLLRKIVTQPGDGASEEERKTHFIEWRGVAEADEDLDIPRKVTIQMDTAESMDIYSLTGLLMVQTALGLLYDEDTLARRLGGGLLTPSTVLTPERIMELERSGFRITLNRLD